MAMQLWLWVVSGVLWLVVIGLTGIGIRKLFNALKLLYLAGLNMFVREGEKVKSRISEFQAEISAQAQQLSEAEELSERSDNILRKAYEAGGKKGRQVI